MKPVYILVRARVRYWEDAYINGEEDKDGTLTPMREGEYWCPVIRLSDGIVMKWPDGITADIHFKVCDDGEYWLLDEENNIIGQWSGHYVPNDFLCPSEEGYGDYIIMNIGADGAIESWSTPSVVWVCNEDGQLGWIKVEGGAA